MTISWVSGPFQITAIIIIFFKMIRISIFSIKYFLNLGQFLLNLTLNIVSIIFSQVNPLNYFSISLVCVFWQINILFSWFWSLSMFTCHSLRGRMWTHNFFPQRTVVSFFLSALRFQSSLRRVSSFSITQGISQIVFTIFITAGTWLPCLLSVSNRSSINICLACS